MTPDTQRSALNTELRQSTLYRRMQDVTKLMDRYYLDGIAGLLPGGIGDILAAIFALIHIYFSAFKLHSVPLTLAILHNTLRDILLGMLPFFVGDVIDFFHKANKQNMVLIDGFITGDPEIVSTVNRKATYSLIVITLLIAGIALMLWLLVWLSVKIGSTLFS